MKDCVFCKIITGLLPCDKVYEDDQFLGFLDIHPLNPGNSILIPKIHYRWVYDVPEFGRYFETAKKISIATIPIVKAETVSLLTLGFEVPHAHIRIIPRFEHDAHTHGIDTLAIIEQTKEQMSELSAKIFASIK